MKEDIQEANEMKLRLTDFNFVYLLNLLSDFLSPITHLDKQLQSSKYKISHLKQRVEDTINILKSDHSGFEKANLVNKINFQEQQEKTIHAVSTSIWWFLLSKCQFINETKVSYKCYETNEDIKVIELNYRKLSAIELKVLIISCNISNSRITKYDPR